MRTGFVHFFQAKNSRTFQRLCRTLLKFHGLFLVRIYHKQRKMFAFKPMFWSMLFLQAKQNALFGFLSSFSSHDLYPSFSSCFSLKWHLSSIVTCSLPSKQIQKCQKTRSWTHVQTRHALCTCGSTYMHESNKRALGKKTSVFTHFVSSSRTLYFVYQNFCFHWPSFTLKP